MVYLSLCIPTNGVSEWVFPVLEAIYAQDVDRSLFEVVVTDNGDNGDFKEKMKAFVGKYDNLVYKETRAFLFENQIEALRLARGEFLKFLNHRSLLEDGALEWMIGLVKEFMAEKPVVYLSDGALGLAKRAEYGTFDGFVAGLKRYASWTTGVGVWKEDFEKIPANWVYNKISPHSDVLFFERKRSKYVIDDKKWCHDIDHSHKNKGKYDLYKAFAVEEISITLSLYVNGDISSKTLKEVIGDYKAFVSWCYSEFNILHRPCSYNIDGFDEAMGVFMQKRDVLLKAYVRIMRDAIKAPFKWMKNLVRGK